MYSLVKSMSGTSIVVYEWKDEIFYRLKTLYVIKIKSPKISQNIIFFETNQTTTKNKVKIIVSISQ